MLELLRSATRSAHEALETELGLLALPLQRSRFVRVLGGFHRFHAQWEPQVAALVADPGLLAPRRRLAMIERDLAALGAPVEAGEAFDLGYLASASAAWGSLYVLEGSTLGGQLISRALETAAWLPPGGLTYFNPYGRRTGAMWAAFRQALEAAAPSLDAEAAAAAATLTFERLRAGLVPPLERAA